MIKKLIGSFAVVLLLPLIAAAAENAPAAPAAPAATKPAETSGNKLPYRGKVSAVDATAKTFSLKDRVFNVTDVTKILKDGAASDMTAITVGEEVRGQALKNSGKWDAVSVMVGAKAEHPKKADAKPATADMKK